MAEEIIKYYDKINKKWISVAVKKEIADEIKQMDKQEKKQRRKIKKYERLFDTERLLSSDYDDDNGTIGEW